MINLKKQPDTVRSSPQSRRGLVWWLLAALAIPMTFVGPPARAQQPEVAPIPRTAGAPAKELVEASLRQFIVVTGADGKEEFKEADSVRPGDILEYRVRYANRSGKGVSNFTATLPLPEQLEYLPKSATPGATLVQAATADSKYAAEPLMRTAPGKKPEPVPYAEYRSLRWNLGQLPADAVTEVAARARVVLPAQPQTVSNASQAPPVRVVWVSPAAAVVKP